MRIAATIDTNSFSSADAQSLRELVDAADFFHLPATVRAQSLGADSFQYRVTIEEQTRKHTVEAGEGGASPELRSLLRRLTVLARSG